MPTPPNLHFRAGFQHCLLALRYCLQSGPIANMSREHTCLAAHSVSVHQLQGLCWQKSGLHHTEDALSILCLQCIIDALARTTLLQLVLWRPYIQLFLSYIYLLCILLLCCLLFVTLCDVRRYSILAVVAAYVYYLC